MRKTRKILLLIFALLLMLPLLGCGKDNPSKEPTVQIDVSEQIVLTNDDQIDWSQYITIQVGEEKIDISNATITLLTGDSSVSGTCTYQVRYKDYTKDFTVTYNYPAPVVPTITVLQPIELTSNENIDWSQYITIQVGEEKIDISKASVTLLTGDSSVSGTCTYQVRYNDYTKDFTVTYNYPAPVVPTITVSQPIELTSNENIDWSQYITIQVGEEKIDISNATVTLLTGDATVSGTCTYQVSYHYQDKDYTKDFTVTYNYPPVETKRALTEEEKQAFLTACSKDYSNVSLYESVFGTILLYDKNLFYIEWEEEDGLTYYTYLKSTDTDYQSYGENGWESITKAEFDSSIMVFNFSAIDINKVLFDDATQMYTISADDLSVTTFCPYWYLDGTTYTSFDFTIGENGCFDVIYSSNVYDNETYYDFCLLTDIGTTVVEAPTDTPTPDVPTPEMTLGDLQTYEDNQSCTVSGIIAGITSKGILLKDLTVDEYVYVYTKSTAEYKLYDIVSVQGTISTFGNAKQISNPTVTNLNQTEEITFEPTVFTADDITAYAQNVVVGLPATITGTLTISGNYYNVAVEGTNIVVSICYPTVDLSAYNKQEITFSGYFIYLSGSNKYANIIYMEEVQTPTLNETELTEEQRNLWNEALNKDYSNYELTDSISSTGQLKANDLFYVTSFDENSYTSLDYYKYINNQLSTYSYTGWITASSNPLFDFKFDLLKNITQITYVEENNSYIIQADQLNISEFSNGFAQTKSKYQFVAFQIDETSKTITSISAVKQSGSNLIYDMVFISNVGTTEIIDPEEQCNLMSVGDVQDMVTEQLCTVEGIVSVVTTKGFILSDPNKIYDHIYVSLNAAPTIEIGHKVKIFGIACPMGTSLQFEEATSTITDLGVSEEPLTFNPSYFSTNDFINYLDDPLVGIEIEFTGVLTSIDTLDIEYFNYDVKLIDTAKDLSQFANQTVYVQAYIMYVEYSEISDDATVYIVLKDMSLLNETNAILKELTQDQITLLNSAKSANYKNVTIIDSIYSSTCSITEDKILLSYINENNQEESSIITINNGSYTMDGQSITKDELYQNIPLFYFEKIDTSKVRYNTRTGLYELSARDLTIEDFAPFFVDDTTTFLGYQFLISEEGIISAVNLVDLYQDEYYVDTCAFVEFGTTVIE